MFITQGFTCNDLTPNQVMEEKIQCLLYSKSKPTAVSAGRHEFWIAEREGNRKELMQMQHSTSFCETAVTKAQKYILFCHP